MGATTFMTRCREKTAKDAFFKAVEQAQWEHGHGGYTGTIAEKDSFVMITPQGSDPVRYADDLLSFFGDHSELPLGYTRDKFTKDQAAVDDKWGPAGCIDLGNGEFLFFGWASE